MNRRFDVDNSGYYFGGLIISIIIIYGLSTNLYTSNNATITPSNVTYRSYSDGVKLRISEALAQSSKFSDLDTSVYVAPFSRMKAYYKLAPEYHLSVCEIEKSMSTLMVGIFCYLFDTENFEMNNRTIPTEWWTKRFCAKRNEVWTTPEIRRFIPGPHTTIYILRDPIERFISAFLNKCIDELRVRPYNCYYCKGDLNCVLKQAYKDVKDYGAGRLVWPKYPLSPKYEVRHFAPQTWYCDLADRYKTFAFIQYANEGEEKLRMADQFGEIFREQGVPEYKIETIRQSITGDKLTRHATHGSSKADDLMAQIKANPENIRMLYEMYEFDYRIFNFTRTI